MVQGNYKNTMCCLSGEPLKRQRFFRSPKEKRARTVSFDRRIVLKRGSLLGLEWTVQALERRAIVKTVRVWSGRVVRCIEPGKTALGKDEGKRNVALKQCKVAIQRGGKKRCSRKMLRLENTAESVNAGCGTMRQAEASFQEGERCRTKIRRLDKEKTKIFSAGKRKAGENSGLSKRKRMDR